MRMIHHCIQSPRKSMTRTALNPRCYKMTKIHKSLSAAPLRMQQILRCVRNAPTLMTSVSDLAVAEDEYVVCPVFD